MRPRPGRAGAGGDPVSAAITLGDAVTALVAEKRAIGYKYDAEEKVLARFAAFCRAEFPGAEAPDRACVEAWIAAAGRERLRPAAAGAAQARPLRPAHLHRPGTGGPVRPDRPVPVLLAGPVPAPGHAGAVPRDLRLRPAGLRGPA